MCGFNHLKNYSFINTNIEKFKHLKIQIIINVPGKHIVEVITLKKIY